MDKIQILSIASSFSLLFIIIYLIKTSKLKIQYSLIWVFSSLLMVIFSIHRILLEKIADMFDVYYAPSLLFFGGLIFVILILLHFSLVISRLSDRIKVLTQEIALLKNKHGS